MDKIGISYNVIVELAKKHRHGHGEMIYVNWTDFKEEAEKCLFKTNSVDRINCLDSIIERAEANREKTNRYVHTLDEIAVFLNVTTPTLYKWSDGGIINFYKVSHKDLPKHLQKELRFSRSFYYDTWDVLLQLKKFQKKKSKSFRK